MNRRNFLSGLLATAGGLVLPEPERVRAYSFMPPKPFGRTRGTWTGELRVTFADGTTWVAPAGTWEIRDGCYQATRPMLMHRAQGTTLSGWRRTGSCTACSPPCS